MTMDRFNGSFPFTAVVGQEKLKEALILCAINPKIGGVLICGEKGTAKSTLARGLNRLLQSSSIVELPLNTTEDRLVGSIDPEATLRKGKPQFQPGILYHVNGGVLYADEVNLLPERIVNILLEVSALGINHVEREGISLSHPSSFVLIGSMNPEEGTLRSAFLDRFGLYVETHGETDAATRCEIMRRRIEYEKNPAAFCKRWEKETEKLSEKLQNAQNLLKKVCLPTECAEYAARLSATGFCQGHRAELTLCQTARAIAALNCRLAVTVEDIQKAAAFALPHRLHEPLTLPQETQDERSPEEAQNTPPSPDSAPPTDLNEPLSSTESADEVCTDSSAMQGAFSEDLQEIKPLNTALSLQITECKNLTALGSGKRLKVRSHTAKGRYVRYGFPKEAPKDIAVDATLRAAVLSGRNHFAEKAPLFDSGCEKALRIHVKKEDFREKIREQRTGAVILFVVDASGSMGAKKRMGAVKGAVLAMLNDAYQKRDTVGIVSFRGTNAQLLLPFTRSVDLAQKCLKNLPTGGTTPLAEGLKKAGNLLRANLIKDKNAAQLMVLVSDGRANYSLTGSAFEEALCVAKELSALPFASLVLDTEQGFAKFGMAKKIADALGGEHCPLSGISEQEIIAHIGKYVR